MKIKPGCQSIIILIFTICVYSVSSNAELLKSTDVNTSLVSIKWADAGRG